MGEQLGPHAWSDGWTGTFMYAWAPDYVRPLYALQRDRHVPNLLDRRLKGLAPHPADNIAGIGYWLPYAAELGDRDTVERLLRFADAHLSPVWRDGRYYYPRNDDARIGPDGVLRLNSALQGNALIAFGRLNVGDGLLRLHNGGWSAANLQEPFLADVDYLAAGVAEARWDAPTRTLVAAFRPGPIASSRTEVSIRQLPRTTRATLSRDGGPGTPVAIAPDGTAHIVFDPRAPTKLQLRCA